MIPVFYDYYIDHVLELPDGSNVMLAEQYHYNESQQQPTEGPTDLLLRPQTITIITMTLLP